MSASYRLGLIRKLIDREFNKEINELRKNKAPGDEIASKQHDHHFELELITEEQEMMYSDRLLKRARQLRVNTPMYPRWIDAEEEYDSSDDWLQGHHGFHLSNEGIAKVREEIRKEEKWRREGRANWATFLSALAGVIGALIGLVAIFSK